jgi:arginine N-succinyltransferase
VEKMLRRIGFNYIDRIDPFDGGPHFIAKTDEITLVKKTQKCTVVKLAETGDAPFALISIERDRPPHFAAVGSRMKLEGNQVGLPDATLTALGIQPGDEVGVLPI